MTVDSAALAAALDEPEDALLAPEMRSFALGHGARTERVTVLVHGLTASPRTWLAFARERHARGESVLAPRLPRHGHADRATNALAYLTEAELREQGRRIVDAAALLGEHITVVGHSMGGALTLHLAHRDARIERAIAIAPFLGIRRLPHDWHTWTRRLLQRAPNRFLWWDPIDRGRSLPPHGYPRYSTRSIVAGLALADALRTDARSGPPVARHVEILRNASEMSVNNRTIDDLVARWRAAGGSSVRVHRVTGLARSHDIVEPERPRAEALRFLPALHGLLDAPPPDRDVTLDLSAPTIVQ
ncbi:MAG: alpha/beta fold hydrolase [Candidatus Eremiobacteraeota bacterium]|nr:alpha/beta fold hydrolase [Candidatus Eremiobacteraeota bacterium]